MDYQNRTFKIGNELEVNRLGYGAMRLTGQPGNFGPYPNWKEGVELIRLAAELRVNFFDSAWAYGPGWADKILAEGLADLRENIVIATKGGVDKSSPGNIVVDGSAKALSKQIDTALQTFGKEAIDLFQLHRPDPDVPIEESVAAIHAAVEQGKVRHVGLSNIDKSLLDRALTVGPVASVQNRFNVSETEDEALVDYTASLGIAYIPYGPLGANPMEQGARLPAVTSISWLLKRSPNIVVIPGTTSASHLIENLSAWDQIQNGVDTEES